MTGLMYYLPHVVRYKVSAMNDWPVVRYKVSAMNDWPGVLSTTRRAI